MKARTLAADALVATALSLALTVASAAAAEHTSDRGESIYKRANCVGCHKWHGGGGGGYGGAALSLRATEFDKKQIMFTVQCGRPGTGMPYFDADAYGADKARNPCGVSLKDLGDVKAAQGGVFLRPEEISAVADYVIDHIKGKGEPTLADCVAFFGDASRVCEVYRKDAHHAMPTPSTTR